MDSKLAYNYTIHDEYIARIVLHFFPPSLRFRDANTAEVLAEGCLGCQRSWKPAQGASEQGENEPSSL